MVRMEWKENPKYHSIPSSKAILDIPDSIIKMIPSHDYSPIPPSSGFSETENDSTARYQKPFPSFLVIAQFIAIGVVGTIAYFIGKASVDRKECGKRLSTWCKRKFHLWNPPTNQMLSSGTGHSGVSSRNLPWRLLCTIRISRRATARAWWSMGQSYKRRTETH